MSECGCFGKFQCSEHYHGTPLPQPHAALWPRKSDAAGVHPKQIPEAIAAAAKRGVKIDFDRNTGEAIFTSPRHEKEYCERVRGLFRVGKGAGFGDPQPQQYDEAGDIRRFH